MNNTFLVASGNKNKIAELQTIAKEYSILLLHPNEVKNSYSLQSPPEVEETGLTYSENARLKAIAFSQWSGLPAIADDTGLEVEALENRPGIYSARYAGEKATSEMLCNKILQELTDLEQHTTKINRRARYACCLSLAIGEQILHEVEHYTYGEILKSPRGSGGFGYDSIVKLDHLEQTLAEIEFSQTCGVGFGAITAKKFFESLVL